MITLEDIRKQWPLKDTMGRYMTQSLFSEFKRGPGVYNLTDFDSESSLSMKKIYLDIADVTEYKAAVALLGSWEHWSKLCEATWFIPYINSWRDELELKIKSEAIQNLRLTSKEEGGKGANAARWLAEGKWSKKSSNKKLLKTNTLPESEEVDNDHKRLGLSH